MGRVHSLFVKPSLECTAACGHCEARRAFYRGRNGARLSLEEHKAVIQEAGYLGARSLHLSGGEPTLYPGLVELVSEGRRVGMFTVLNTNGSLITPDYAADLVGAGLDSVIISLHSHRPEEHDSVRRRKGNFDEVVRAIDTFKVLQHQGHPRFIISTQTIVLRSNYRDLPAIIDLVCSLDVDAHGISYVEGDFALQNTPTIEDVGFLRTSVLPEVAARLKRHRFRHPILKYAALRLVSRLYSGNTSRRLRMSSGVYLERVAGRKCRTPKGFVMVLADGSVLPCNMVEYTGGPILGNVRRTRLAEVIASDRWTEFARAGYEYCRHCPTHLHFHVPISTSVGRILPLLVKNPAYEQKSIPRRVREALWH